MIVRARPRFLTAGMLDETGPSPDVPEHELFFTCGRGALAFLFRCWQERYGRAPLVAMQSFNCEAVILPVLQAGGQVLLLDIGLEDFSVRLATLEQIENKPDILVLTHYQGLPNREYPQIAAYCREHDILLIEDCAQTEGSSLAGIAAGTRGDCMLRSYAYDKPCTCLEGGSIDAGGMRDDGLRRIITERYECLAYENQDDARRDIRVLRFLWDFTREETYLPGFDQARFIQTLAGLGAAGLYGRFLSGLKKMRCHPSFIPKMINLVIWAQIRHEGTIQTLRLDDRKRALVLRQRRMVEPARDETAALEKLLRGRDIPVPQHPDAQVNWNRYSLLDHDGRIRPLMRERGVEARNFNWPAALHVRYGGNPSVSILGNSADNSLLASRKIINIPVWSSVFRSGRTSER